MVTVNRNLLTDGTVNGLTNDHSRAGVNIFPNCAYNHRGIGEEYVPLMTTLEEFASVDILILQLALKKLLQN